MSQKDTIPDLPHPALTALRMLWRDKFAFAAAIFLCIVVFCALFGPALLEDVATKQNLRGRNAPPVCTGITVNLLILVGGWAIAIGAWRLWARKRGLPRWLLTIVLLAITALSIDMTCDFSSPWHMWLGGDALGRPLLARIIVAAQNTIMVATGAVICSVLIGTSLGLVAGYTSKLGSQIIMRLADVIMAFPSLLLAVLVLYMLPPSVYNLIIVLAITRIPVYLRTSRAEVLEIRERMFVQAAQVMGAAPRRIVFRHILPVVFPTLLTIATLDFALVVLVESSLSFLGIGIQPPEITWGLMVSQGRAYLTTAWWLSFWPGLAIILTTLSLNLLANWMRTALDPVQRWRLEIAREKT